MSRTIPRAYVTAAWSKNRVDAEDQARKYCSELVKAGYLPLCPVLAFSGTTILMARRSAAKCLRIFLKEQDFSLSAARRSMMMSELISHLQSIQR